jgi:hypothetical protein
MKRERLTRRQIECLRHLARFGQRYPITVPKHLRAIAIALVRRDLAEMWYRQTPGQVPALRGPFFSLSTGGGRLASSFPDDRDAVTPGPTTLASKRGSTWPSSNIGRATSW